MYLYTIDGHVQILRLQIAMTSEKQAIKVRVGSDHLVKLASRHHFSRENKDASSFSISFVFHSRIVRLT